MEIGLSSYLAVAAILFTIGVVGIFLNRKNIIIILMSIELILLAVNLNFVAFDRHVIERNDGQRGGHEQQARGDKFAGARANHAAEQAGDGRSDDGKEDDCCVHHQPFITLTSSTAMVPRLRK